MSTGKGEMKTYIFCALNSPFSGQDKEFNNWYGKYQVPAIVSTKGVVSAQRFVRSEVQMPTAGVSPQYIAIYKIVTDDLARVFAALDESVKEVPKDSAHDATQSQHYTYQELGSLITHDEAKHKNLQK